MRLLCTIGSMHILKPRMVLKRGDEFEIDDLKGSSLILHGYAVQIPDVPAVVEEPGTNPPDSVEAVANVPTKKLTTKKKG